MESQSYFFLIFLGFITCSSCEANHTFYAGGKSGWVLKPSESYSHWTHRNRFQVNDTIVFKYKIGSDSVLEVEKDDYSKCNKDKPILELKDGDSVFKFDRSGPFYFISGHEDNCEKGQKLIVVVLSPNHKAHKNPRAFSPAPAESIGQVSPAPAPAPAKSAAEGLIGGFSWGFISLIIAAYFCIMV